MLQRDRAETQPCYTEIVRPKWRNGRRAGLKNRWENIPCRFESDLRHHFLNNRVVRACFSINKRRTALFYAPTWDDCGTNLH